MNQTGSRLLHKARDLFLKKGFQSLSFQELADSFDMRKASIYYHFESKEALGIALLEYFDAEYQKFIIRITDRSPRVQLRALFSMYETYAQNGKGACPFGIVSIEFANLPKSMQRQIKKNHDRHREYLINILQAGSRSGNFAFKMSVEKMADLVMSSIQGAMQIPRIRSDENFFMNIRHSLTQLIKG